MSWADIESYEGKYAVSELGEVISWRYAKGKESGLLSQSDRRGYPSVYLRKPKEKGKYFTVHALVAKAFIGPRPNGFAINHIDGNKRNNVSSNLEYCTHSENAKHSFRLGLQCNKGEQHSQAKLNESNVVEILSRLRRGEKQSCIAKDFGVDDSQVSNINRGKAWPHVSRKAG